MAALDVTLDDVALEAVLFGALELVPAAVGATVAAAAVGAAPLVLDAAVAADPADVVDDVVVDVDDVEDELHPASSATAAPPSRLDRIQDIHDLHTSTGARADGTSQSSSARL